MTSWHVTYNVSPLNVVWLFSSWDRATISLILELACVCFSNTHLLALLNLQRHDSLQQHCKRRVSFIHSFIFVQRTFTKRKVLSKFCLVQLFIFCTMTLVMLPKAAETRGVRYSKHPPALRCRVLPPGKFNGVTPLQLSMHSESFMTIA